jgi:membrane protease YdiL (CAAX protease family)
MSTSRLLQSVPRPDVRVPGPAVVLPTIAITVSEGALYFGRLDVALWGHLFTLLACTLAPVRFDDNVRLLQVFALVPLFRLVNLGMPIFVPRTLYWFPLVYGPLIPALFLLARAREDTRPGLGLRNCVLLLPIAIPLSALLAEVEFAILVVEPQITAWTLEQVLHITVIMLGFVGFVEELLFRGILQQTLESRLGRIPGLVLTSVFFGLMHSGYGIPAELLFAGGVGLVFGVVYDLTDSLALVSVMHGVLNVFLFAVIPIQGSLWLIG